MFIRVVYVTVVIMFLDIMQAYLDGRPGRHIFIRKNCCAGNDKTG